MRRHLGAVVTGMCALGMLLPAGLAQASSASPLASTAAPRATTASASNR